MNHLQLVTDEIYNARETFDKMSGGSLNFEKEAGFAVQILAGNDYAMKIAASNRQSVMNAVCNVAAIGISLNPAKKQAYLVPRDGKICLDISYMGLLDLAIEGGGILWGQAELVHESDAFVLNGFDKPPTHNRNPFAKDRGAIVGVYVVVKTKSGDYLTSTMSIDEVYAIRDRSQSWKSGRTTPWKTDEGEMIKKTVVKRAYKMWPKSDKLDKAVHYLNESGEGIEFVQEVPRISAVDGAMASLSTEEQDSIRDLSMEVIALINSDELAVAFDLIESQKLESEQRTALWSCLDSKARSALKKEGQERKNEQAAKKQESH